MSLRASTRGRGTTRLPPLLPCRQRPDHGRGRPSAILTALANDVGPEVLFQRQVIAHGREGDVALAFSTSGGSANILAALAEARRRGLMTIALVGYDGGRIAADGLADHVLLSPSPYIPRIQEAQATAYHLLCEAVSAMSHARVAAAPAQA
jgi:D-sedoheptulose 7-phosphate isomerase